MRAYESVISLWQLTFTTRPILVTMDMGEKRISTASNIHYRHAYAKSPNTPTHRRCSVWYGCRETSPNRMFCHWSSSLEAKLRMHVLASISGVILMMERHHRRDQLENIFGWHVTYNHSQHPAKGVWACSSTPSFQVIIQLYLVSQK